MTRSAPDLDFGSLISVEINNLDEVDRQLVHALFAAPRATYRVLAETVGVSDQTIARRYRRLSEAAGLRVHGVVNGPRAGWVDWLVRLQTTPGSADRIADTLARRPDTRWVRLFSGGTEITCVLQARTPEQRNALFLRALPGSRRVVQISAHSILHVFSPVAWQGVTNALSGTQLARLDPLGTAQTRTDPAVPENGLSGGTPAGAAPAGGDAVTLRPEDDLLLAELARDGRAPNSALAAATHWHESTVRRRIGELQQAGLLSFDVDIGEAFLGVSASAMLWLAVDPAHLEAAGRAVAAHPEVPFAAATTGPTNLVISAVFRDTRHLYEYLTTRLPGLPGVRSVETAPIIGTLKRTGSRAAPLPVRD
jgi:DNA-binding Lrp family transcriptional regulator